MLGDECFVGENAVLAAGVKVYPFKTVEAGAVVNSSIVWESRGARIAVRAQRRRRAGQRRHHARSSRRKVAMAYGTTLKKGATVVTSRDSSRSARMLKRAMMAGLNAAGVNVARPRGRVACRSPASSSRVRRASRRPHRAARPGRPAVGGRPLLRQRRAPTSPRTPSARSSGCSTARTSAGSSPPRSATSASRRGPLEHYTIALETTVDVRRIAAARFKVVVDYAYGSTSFVMPNVLAKLGADVLAVNPYASTAGVISLRPRGPRRATSPTWCGRRAPTSAR